MRPQDLSAPRDSALAYRVSNYCCMQAENLMSQFYDVGRPKILVSEYPITMNQELSGWKFVGLPNPLFEKTSIVWWNKMNHLVERHEGAGWRKWVMRRKIWDSRILWVEHTKVAWILIEAPASFVFVFVLPKMFPDFHFQRFWFVMTMRKHTIDKWARDNIKRLWSSIAALRNL